MQISSEMRDALTRLKISVSQILSNTQSMDHSDIENSLYSMEKYRADIYDQIKDYNIDNHDKQIHTITEQYHASIINDMLYVYVPEKLPNLKNISSYVYKQILLNVSEVASKYKGLFHNDFVIIIIKICDKEKIWDVDNRTVKPIQDGLVNAGVIIDDNFKNSCYMVQGFYSEKPYIDVFVLKAANILKFINKKLPDETTLEMAKF